MSNWLARTFSSTRVADFLPLPVHLARSWIDRVRNSPVHNYPKNSQRRILVDVSVIFNENAKTGIQKVVTSILGSLKKIAQNEFEIICIAADRGKGYFYVDLDFSKLCGKVDVVSSDVFFGLDLCTKEIPENFSELREWKLKGVVFCFVVYDILPLTNKNFFRRARVNRFKKWWRCVLVLADKIVCISFVVESEVHKQFERAFLKSEIATLVTHLAVDRSESRQESGFRADFSDKFFDENARNIVLMVGTLEPRKSHREVLAAFNFLWNKGSKLILLIVGRIGWLTEDIQESIKNHALYGKQLFWVQDATDDEVSRFYSKSTGLLFASKAEGFGLPVIEALSHGKPVLARNLEVFKEIARDAPTYFSSDSASELGREIERWINTASDRELSSGDRSWDMCASEIIDFVAAERTYG